MRGSTVHGVGKYGVRITCVGSDDYLPILPTLLAALFFAFLLSLGRDRVGQIGMWGNVRAGIEHRMAWDEWNGKLVGPQARVHSYALAGESPPENEWLPLLSYFRQTQDAGFSGAGTSYVHIFTSLGGGQVLCFCFRSLIC